MEKKKTSTSFWIVFALLIGVAAISTFGNLFEYRRMEKLNTEGKRIRLPVDSISIKGSKTEIFVQLNVRGKSYTISKKVKTTLAVGDSVSVYYLEVNPATNGIAEN
jgi:hypothetical protein